jgi:hypothetical protein
MIRIRWSVASSRAALVTALVAMGCVTAAGESQDATAVSKLLAETKATALALKVDVGVMESLTRSSKSPEQHANTFNQVREHINTAVEQVAKLQKARGSASAWQRVAIDRIAPLVEEIAFTSQRVLDVIKNNPGKITSNEYREYLQANVDHSDQLATLISRFVEYGKTKQRLDRLSRQLEIPPTS